MRAGAPRRPRPPLRCHHARRDALDSDEWSVEWVGLRGIVYSIIQWIIEPAGSAQRSLGLRSHNTAGSFSPQPRY